jgi:riboflavin synthase
MMFSGITQGLFSVASCNKQEDLWHYSIRLNQSLIKGLNIGASVAVDGVCQTVVKINECEVYFDAMAETLAKTTLRDLFIGRKVSVERSIRLGDELGGHELSGHIFETGLVLDRKKSANNLCLIIQCSESCFPFIKSKGFIAVDGSSLTVGLTNKKQCSFEIYLIPETLRVTHFASKNKGDQVNLEPDMKTMILVETVRDYFSAVEDRLEKIENKLKSI